MLAQLAELNKRKLPTKSYPITENLVFIMKSAKRPLIQVRYDPSDLVIQIQSNTERLVICIKTSSALCKQEGLKDLDVHPQILRDLQFIYLGNKLRTNRSTTLI